MTDTERLLLACLHHDRTRLEREDLGRLNDDDWGALFALAAKQRVRPTVYQQLGAVGAKDLVPAEEWDRLGDACRRIAVKNLRLQQELFRVGQALAEASIPTAVLKGLHATGRLYDGIAEREIGDLDLLVPPRDLPAAVAIMRACGYEPWRQSPLDLDVRVSQHASLLVRGSFRVELHWSLAPPARSYSIDPTELWPRTRPLPPFTPLVSLSGEDLLLHSCAHAAYLHAFEFGLRSICDVGRMLERYGAELDWPAVIERSDRWRWSRGVRLTLSLARELVGAPLPPACVAFLDRTPVDPSAVEAARSQVLAGFDLTRVPGLGITVLSAPVAIRSKLQYIFERLALPLRYVTRRPDGKGRWLSWEAYSERLRHPLRRYAVGAIRLWIQRDPGVRRVAKRQRTLRAYLFGSASD